MQIEKYIGELLYRYECVIIPGFGAFLTQKTSAQLDEEASVFHPPKKKLSFNAQLVENDGLLASHVSKSENIPYNAAVKNVAAFCNQIKKKLEYGETVVLHKIGAVTRSEHGTLNFEPHQTVNYLTSSFGLSSYSVTKTQREVYALKTAKLEESAPIFISDRKRKAPSWIKYAAIGLIALTVAGTLGYTNIRNIEEHNTAARSEAKNQLDAKIQQATFVISNPLPAINLQLERPTGNYHIVAGAFRIQENAAKHVDELLEKGYKARQIGTNKYGLHQVVYNSYARRREALNALKEVRANENAAAWMLVEELQ
ncbi:MAG: SPOR domain-containing protein [Leeuwenhoekiella sp.]